MDLFFGIISFVSAMAAHYVQSNLRNLRGVMKEGRYKRLIQVFWASICAGFASFGLFLLSTLGVLTWGPTVALILIGVIFYLRFTSEIGSGLRRPSKKARDQTIISFVAMLASLATIIFLFQR